MVGIFSEQMKVSVSRAQTCRWLFDRWEEPGHCYSPFQSIEIHGFEAHHETVQCLLRRIYSQIHIFRWVIYHVHEACPGGALMPPKARRAGSRSGARRIGHRICWQVPSAIAATETSLPRRRDLGLRPEFLLAFVFAIRPRFLADAGAQGHRNQPSRPAVGQLAHLVQTLPRDLQQLLLHRQRQRQRPWCCAGGGGRSGPVGRVGAVPDAVGAAAAAGGGRVTPLGRCLPHVVHDAAQECGEGRGLAGAEQREGVGLHGRRPVRRVGVEGVEEVVLYPVGKKEG